MARIGVFSDVHANLAALNAVLDRLDQAGCEQLVCGGDTVGYGSSPGECIHILQDRQIPCVLGNHDQYVTLLMDERVSRLRDDVRVSVEWTQNALDMGDLRWLAQLPMRIDLPDLTIVHGAFGHRHWTYLTNEQALSYNFAHQDVPLAFCGHSHVPIVSYTVEDSSPVVRYLKDTTSVPDAGKVIFNVGSVGQPRDHDPRAMCVVFDTETRCVEPSRVPYDIEATQDLMRRTGQPEKSISRIELGR